MRALIGQTGDRRFICNSSSVEYNYIRVDIWKGIQFEYDDVQWCIKCIAKFITRVSLFNNQLM